MRFGQRMVEVQPFELFATGGGDNGALQTVALQAGFDQRFGQQQQTTFGIHQRVVELRVQVEGLVGRDRPGGRGPDQRIGFLSSCGSAKAAASLSGSAARKATSTVCDFLSAYSISNSASELPQSKHQYTGFRPR